MTLTDMLFQINLARGRYGGDSLAPASAQVYSQNGEDGIIAEIFRRIGVRDRYFVELGVGDGTENCTRLLLESGWRGVWLDTAEESLIRANFGSFMESGQLTFRSGYLNAEGVNAALDEAGVPAEFDFLSVDLDQNTSHVWRAINRRARVACVEYNASIPTSVELEVRYHPTVNWDETNHFGGSLKAVELIGAAKELALVGCDLTGNNAFLVARSEAPGKFRQPFTAESHWEPPRHFAGRVGHPPSAMGREWDAEVTD